MNVSEMILSAISTGEDNAVSADYLAKITGLTVRELRQAVETLRRNGHVIVSSNNGYYYPATLRELERHIKKESRRARSISLTLHSAREMRAKWKRKN